MIALASGYGIKDNGIEKYTVDMEKLFVSLYIWFYMPPSVHKVLIHGTDVIRISLLPIGNCYVLFKLLLLIKNLVWTVNE